MRPLAILCAAFAIGCAAAQYVLPETMLPVAALAVCLAGLTGFAMHGARRRTVFLCTAACAFALLYNALCIRLIAEPNEALAGGQERVTMELCGYARETKYGAKVTVRILDHEVHGYAAYYGDASLLTLEPGQQVTDEVAFHSAVDPTESGDELRSFTAKGVYLLLYSRGEPEYEMGNAGTLRYAPQRMARALGETLDRSFGERESGFLHALLLGDKSRLDEGDSTRLSEAGIYHIMAVSGLHCAFLAALLDALLRPVHRRTRCAVTIALLLLYAFMTGASPSVLRAVVMISMTRLAPLFGRESDPPTSVLFALGLLLLKNPFAIASISLQLSFAAVAGLACLTPYLTERIRTKNRLLRPALISFATTLGATVFSAPLCAWYFGSLSFAAFLSNLVCLWVVSLTFAAGLLGALVSMLFPAAAPFAAVPATLGIRFVLTVTGWIVRLPFYALYFNSTLSVLWLVYVYALFTVCVITRRGRYRYHAAVTLAVLMLVFTVWANAARFERGTLHVTALDVGQGESVALISHGHGALVDCGSSNSYIGAGGIAADYFSSAGIRSLDAVVLTHYHADHANGLAELFSRMWVDALYLPDIAEEEGEKTAVLALAERYGIPVRYVTEETTAALGNAGMTAYPPVGKGDANELGLTVLCSAGEFDTLITGDMDSETEKLLLDAYPLPDIEVLLVGHHGSRYSTSEELLEATAPEVGVVSVGNNSYGHPTEEALLRLTDAGVSVYRTDLQGNIHIRVN